MKAEVNKSNDINSAQIRVELKTEDLPFRSDYKDEMGQMRPCFKLPFRETMLLMTGYRIDLRAKVLDRWTELEKREAAKIPAGLPDFTNPVAAARAWAETKEAELALSSKVQPKTSSLPSSKMK